MIEKWIYLIPLCIGQIYFTKAEWKVQTCNNTGEPFQVSYTHICDIACVQKCEANLQEKAKTCISLPKYCEGFPAECGESGCECLSSSLLPGNPYSSDNIADHVVERITCEDDIIKVHLEKCAVNELGFFLDDFYINGIADSSHIPPVNDARICSDVINNCRGSVEINEDGLHYLFEIKKDLGGCNGLVEENESDVRYSNAIKATTKKEKAQPYAIYIVFSCTFGRSFGRDALLAMRPTAHEVKVFSGKLYNDFNIRMELWEEDWYKVPYDTSDKFITSNYIYVTIEAEVEETERYKVQVLQATVTSTSSKEDVYSYPLIVDGCASSAYFFNDEVVIHQNGDEFAAMFKFRAFQLLDIPTEDDQIVYLHVVAHLCDEIFESKCSLECNERSGREVDTPEPNIRTVTSQPITVSKWRRVMNETGHNITVMQALDYLTESWEMTLMIGCILLLILTLMISMCVLLIKLSNHNPPNALKDEE